MKSKRTFLKVIKKVILEFNELLDLIVDEIEKMMKDKKNKDE